MQQQSTRRSACGQWLDAEESLDGVLAPHGQPTSAKRSDARDQSPETKWVTSGLAGDGPGAQQQWTTSKLQGLGPARKPVAVQKKSASKEKPSVGKGDLAGHEKAGVDIGKLLEEVEVERMAAEADDGALRPMGEARPDFSSCEFPRVEVIEGSDGKFHLEPTSATHRGDKHVCKLTDIGVQSLGLITKVDEENNMITTGGGHPRFVKSGAKAEWVNKRELVRGVDKTARREIEVREFEHLIDFAYAFKLATEPTVKAVNGLTGTAFESADKAIKAVIDQLGGHPQLIPQQYRDSASWARRAHEVADLVAEGSSKRDSEGHHSPKGFEIDPDTSSRIIIRPVFKDKSFSSMDIIFLADAPSVFGGFKESKSLTLGAQAKLSKGISVPIFDGPNGKEIEKRGLDAGLLVKVVELGSKGDALVSAKALDVQPENNDTNMPKAWRLPELIYFKVATEFLQ